MPSTYTQSGVELIGNGEQSGTWGTTTNRNLEILDRMISQAGVITLSGTTHTLTISDGVLSDGQYGILVFGGAPSGTNTVTISPNDAQRTYIVKNDSGEDVVLTQGSGGNVTVADGRGAIVYCDGAGSGAAVVDLTATFTATLATLGVTASAAELNILDGATLDTAELNTLDGITASTAELNILDGVTASTAELNILDGVTATTAELNILDGVTATTAELNYLDTTALGKSQASKAVTADANGVVEFADGINEGFTTVTSSSGNASVDCRDGNVFAITLSENTTFTFDNPPTSGTAYGFVLKVVQDSTPRTITWPASVDWAAAISPTLSAGSGDVDVFVFFSHDGGTNWYGFIAGQNLS